MGRPYYSHFAQVWEAGEDVCIDCCQLVVAQVSEGRGGGGRGIWKRQREGEKERQREREKNIFLSVIRDLSQSHHINDNGYMHSEVGIRSISWLGQDPE